jgi:hypothetical protein
MNKTRSHLHMFFLKNQLTHRCFKSLSSICSSWINRVNFIHFRPNKIYVSPTDIVSSLFPLQYRPSSGRRRHTVAQCHIFFLLSQDELADSASSFGNTSPRRLPSQPETEALNLHHHSRPPSLHHLTPTLHYYKKIISILVTLPTTQSHFHFISSIARAPHHRSSTHHRRSLLPLSHVHRPSVQWHLHWQTSRSSFTF